MKLTRSCICGVWESCHLPRQVVSKVLCSVNRLELTTLPENSAHIWCIDHPLYESNTPKVSTGYICIQPSSLMDLSVSSVFIYILWRLIKKEDDTVVWHHGMKLYTLACGITMETFVLKILIKHDLHQPLHLALIPKTVHFSSFEIRKQKLGV